MPSAILFVFPEALLFIIVSCLWFRLRKKDISLFILQKRWLDFSYHVFVLGMTIQSFDLVGMDFFWLQVRASIMLFSTFLHFDL